MSELQIRNVPENMKRAIKSAASLQGKSMRDVVLEATAQYLGMSGKAYKEYATSLGKKAGGK